MSTVTCKDDLYLKMNLLICKIVIDQSLKSILSFLDSFVRRITIRSSSFLLKECLVVKVLYERTPSC